MMLDHSTEFTFLEVLATGTGGNATMTPGEAV
jgi:hypothetical protein